MSMDEARAAKLIEAVVSGSRTLSDVAGTALRNRKSLTSGPYGNKFHDLIVKFAKLNLALKPLLGAIEGFDSAILQSDIATVTSLTATINARDMARKRIRLILETEVLPNIGSLSSPENPRSEMVLPATVLAGAPSYLQRTLLQANGCYERRWFDACSVMIRKLVENLIIEVYEKHGKEAEIKKDGNYLMLSGLVTAILGQKYWQLQRDTKKELPHIKTLGDRAAHIRRYQPMRQDVDQILVGLRTTIDELMHLAGFK